MSDPSDNRKYSRSPIDFVLEVSAESEEGIKFKDKAVLEDVSGEGAMSQTGKGDMYFTGQLLNNLSMNFAERQIYYSIKMVLSPTHAIDYIFNADDEIKKAWGE